MKAITLYQPWAILAAIGAKRNETRSWATKYRGPLAIHAGAERKYIDMRSKYYICDKEPFRSILTNLFKEDRWLWEDLFSREAILAISNLESCFPIKEGPLLISDRERAFGNYTPGRFVWVLKYTKRLDHPIPAKGKQRLWEWTPPDSLIVLQ